jgi:hypothetical protein
MQAGLVNKCLTFREVFTSVSVFFLFVLIVVFRRHRRNELTQNGGCDRYPIDSKLPGAEIEPARGLPPTGF